MELTTVTLVAVTSVAVKETVAAMERSLHGLRFARSILLSDEHPDLEPGGDIEWRRINRLTSHADYSRFMLHELLDHVDTDHVLCVQWDGFVIRPESWSPKFLAFDYIGAPWPQFDDRHTVGNGGFSLRSRRLLKACQSIELLANEPEDVAICRRCRPMLEKEGISFAPPEVAQLFSYERSAPRGDEFGFHGIFNFLPLMGSKSFRLFVADLDSRVIGGREWRDLLMQSLRTLDVSLAAQLLRRKLLEVIGRLPRSKPVRANCSGQ